MSEQAVAAKPLIHVAAGVLQRADGQVLLAQRPEGKIAAGYWEFPGGKIEPGESARSALERELHEELGISVRAARPLIRFRHDYSDRSVVLDTWLVTAFEGEVQGREAQAFRWTSVTSLLDWPQALPTVAPTARVLGLPVDYVFTPALASLAQLQRGLDRLPAGALLRLRQLGLDDDAYHRWARELLPAVRAVGLRLVLDRDPVLARDLGADGWHASSAALAELQQRPTLAPALVLASCHTPAELARALHLQFDAAVLGPVLTTKTHPGQPALGWVSFGDWVQRAGLPVYALGGVGPAQREQAFAAYAQGVSGISAYWSESGD